MRVLYFDKPPDRSWSLPWHRDRTIAVKRNDLFHGQFRKLLSHSSRNSRPGSTLHRRVIHIELAPGAELPDGYEWHSFVP